MKILLVQPSGPGDTDTQLARSLSYLEAKAMFGPHALVTVAALTPSVHQVALHDERVRGPASAVLASRPWDVVGISVTPNQLGRCLELAAEASQRAPGAKLVAGGIGAGTLEDKAAAFDAVFYGEAEQTWPEYLRALETGGPVKRRYQQLVKSDLTALPPPRWDLVAADVRAYSICSVQTTRGCPFDCSFCDVIYTFGRAPRRKTVAQVVDEVRALQKLGAFMVLLADDNFAANRAYAKEVLRALIALNQSFKAPLGFLTQVDVTVSTDDELLDLMAQANFVELMIGIESVDKAALEQMNKKQNLKVDAEEAVRRIHQRGIVVLGHLIVGSDADGPQAFDRTAEFVDRANLLHHYIHPLTAPPGTRLWYQLARQGRLVALPPQMRDHMDVVTNVVPQQMTRVELFENLARYLEQVNDPERFAGRALRFLDGVRLDAAGRSAGPGGVLARLRMMARMAWFYALGGGRAHRRAFFRIVAAAARRSPKLVPRAIFLYTTFCMDWFRTRDDVRVARAQAEWERSHPGALTAEVHAMPMPPVLRERPQDVFEPAWARVRRRVADRAVIASVVQEAVSDWLDRFGKELDEVDAAQRVRLEETCDRVLDARALAAPAGDAAPVEAAPVGFAREMSDTLDRSLRLRRYYLPPNGLAGRD